jgi:hypothetical protein
MGRPYPCASREKVYTGCGEKPRVSAGSGYSGMLKEGAAKLTALYDETAGRTER